MTISIVYLTNVAITLGQLLGMAAPIFLVGFLLRKRIRYFWQFVKLAISAMVVIALMASSNLPKNQTFDRAQSRHQLNQFELERRVQQSEIEDRTRQPSLDEQQRADRFNSLVDYHKNQ